MASFFKPAGSDLHGFDPGTNKQALGIGNSSTVALALEEVTSAPLTIRLNDPSVATVTETPSSNEDVRNFRISGVASGHAMLEAKDSNGIVLGFMQIEVAKPMSWREVMQHVEITDADRKNLSPESLESLERNIRELRDHEWSVVTPHNPDRYSFEGMVREGETRPPDWQKHRKGK